MIKGSVNADFEPIIPLSIYGFDGELRKQVGIVDTGFNGWLSLPPELIAQLGLKWKRRGRAILGDGSECLFDIYEAVLLWDGEFLKIPLDEADSEPLVGMSLMEGYQLVMTIKEGGFVKLNRVSGSTS